MPITLISFSKASFINIYPGSDMQGVPASETNDISLPSFKRFIISN